MKNINTVFKREINAYFNSPIAYIFIIVFILISAGLYIAQFFLLAKADMRLFFFSLPLILCVFLPVITMRLWAEDRRGNTLELLLTFPMNTHELVLGKFFASLVFYAAALFSTVTIPVMLIIIGNPDIGAIICQYAGAVLLGSFFLALGILISGFCRDQIVSFIIALIACFGLFFLGTDFMVSSIDGWAPGLGSFLRSSVALAHHFSTFQKGIIDSRDVLYFLIGTVIFLTLNTFWLESRLRPKAKSIFSTTCLVSFGIFIVINFILSDIPIGRFDCTQGRIYTIHRSTRQILLDLKTPVTLKLFISSQEKMPGVMKTLERDIRDKLDEFKVAAKGKLNYKVFHMEAVNIASEEDSLEKSIESKGIRPFQVQSIEADEMGVKLIYSAISIAYKEKAEEIIPQITHESLFDLEYGIISKIYRMTLDQAPSLALVAPYTEKDIDPQLKQVLQRFTRGEIESLREDEYEAIPKILRYEGYEVSRIKLTKDEPIPKDTTTLIVIDQEKLNDRQGFEINRFLVNGGAVLLIVQNYNFEFLPLERGGIGAIAKDREPQVNPLLKEWGLGVSKELLMDTEVEIISLGGGNVFGFLPLSQPVKMPMQIKVLSDNMNNDISITSHLSSLFYLWGSALEVDYDKLKELNLDVRTLFTSSPHAWTVAYHEGNITEEDVTPPAANKRRSFPLAVFVTGYFPDAFEGKQVPPWPEDRKKEQEGFQAPAEERNISPKHGKFILVGCSQMFTKKLLETGGHIQFFLNSVDAISLGEKLIGVRSKVPIDRSIGKISSAAKFGWRIFAIGLVPVLLCIIGSVRVFMRKRAKWAYLKAN
ncbi:MAG: Gldg family protein [Candidatus Omnitrophota bacterium]